MRKTDQTNYHSLVALNRELARVQEAILPRLRGAIQHSFPRPILRRVRKYLLDEWLAAYPIRAFLAIMGYCCVEGKFSDVLDIATAVELAQLASLVIDDVIDHSETRDGPSAYHLFGQDVCILMGDILKGTASICIATAIERNRRLVNGPEALRQFESVYRDVCIGQLMDVWHERHRRIAVPEYLKMIHLTTGGFLAGTVSIGATLAGASNALRPVLQRYANCLGMAFQIYDDVLDLVPQKVQRKPFANDIRRRKQRLPLLRYLQTCPRSERQNAMQILRKPKMTNTETRLLVNGIIENGSLEYAFRSGKQFSARARSSAMLLPSSFCRGLLLSMVDFIQPENDELISERWREWFAFLAPEPKPTLL